MVTPTFRRYLEVAEELYVAGHRLHAFATLHALLCMPTAISPCYRREETLCRVRAAEMMLLLRPLSTQPQSRDAASSTTAVQLDLVQSILSPMVSSRRYFESAVVCPLLWTNCSRAGAKGFVKEVTQREEVGKKNDSDDEDDDNDNNNNNYMVPLALVVKAYVLNAIVHRRWLRHAQAVKYLEAAQNWCSAVLVLPSRGNAVKYSNRVDVLQQEEEGRCCEAYLEMELCRVYYSQLMSATRPAGENRATNAAVLHRTCVQALDRLVHHSRNYAGYIVRQDEAQEDLNHEDDEGEKDGNRRQRCRRRRQLSALCLSSPENTFSIGVVARVLCHYYCIALVFSHQLAEAEMHMLQCEELFGASPELQCLRRLLAMGYRGPLAAPALPGLPRLGVKRQRGDARSDEDRTVVKNCTLFREELRWVSDGLLDALRTYLDLHAAGTAVDDAAMRSTATKPTKNTRIKGESSNGGGGSHTIINSSGREVKRLFQSTLHRIDAHLTLLTTTTTTASSCSHRPLKSHVSPLCSSPSSDVRFLVLLKCAALVTMAGYAISQLWLREGVRCLVQLRRYMAVFHRQTAGLRMHSHLLAAQLSMMMSLRHLPGEGDAGTNIPSDAGRQRLSEKEEEENTAGFDVGLPYAHIRAAEMAGLETPHLRSTSTLLMVSVMKGVALYHASHAGSSLQLGGSGFTVAHLTVHQRHRCSTALINVLEALKTSFSLAFVKDDKTPMERENNMQQLCRAWSFSNRLLLLLLRGVAAIAEEKDDVAAIKVFAEATQESRQYFGPLSSTTAECLYLLAVARREYERVQWQIPKERASHSSTASEVEHLTLVDTGEGTQNALPTFSVAWNVALHASRLALLHCALGVQGSGDREECMRIVDEWNTELHHVCLMMRRELAEAVSL